MAVNEVRMLQLNCQKGYAVMSDLCEILVNERVDVCMLQEPYVMEGRVRGLVSGMRVFVSENGKAAVAVCSDAYECLELERMAGESGVCVWIKGEFGEMYVVSMYCVWGDDINPYIQCLDRLFEQLHDCNVLVGTDMNASSGLWHSKGRNWGRDREERGRSIEEWLLTNEWSVSVLNVPSPHYTFSGAMGQSDIDVTLTNVCRSEWRFEWKVMSEWGISDHNPILICMEYSVVGCQVNPPQSKWSMKNVEWMRYIDVLRDCADECGLVRFMDMNPVDMVEHVTRWIVSANDECMRRVKGNKRRVGWWTNELSDKKREVGRLRKRYQRARRNGCEDVDVMWREWRTCVNEYKRLMRSARLGDWQRFVQREGRDPWGAVYRVCRRHEGAPTLAGLRSQGGCARTWVEGANVLMERFFPRGGINREVDVEYVRMSMAEYDWEEVDGAVRRLKQRKAPGLDGITSVMIKYAWKAIPLYVKSMYDACLSNCSFPRKWKEARVIALLKGIDRDRTDPGSYRPISLINGLAKVLERMMIERMRSRMEGKWNERQYGFVQGACTEDAWERLKKYVSESRKQYVLGIFVDFRGAFDHLLWGYTLRCLHECGCSENDIGLWKSYFSERRVCMGNRMDEIWMNVERGCPQGSIAGPYLWNLCMNELLNRINERNERYVAYADDLVIVVEGNARVDLERMGNECMEIVYEWGERSGVSVSSEKTVCMMLKGSLNVVNRHLRVHGSVNGVPEVSRIRFVNEVKYLGIRMSERMSFAVHVRGLRARVVSLVGCMRRVLRKEWSVKRRATNVWMKGLFLATALYGASVWYECMRHKYARDELNRCMRAVMYVCVRVCRTVSTEAMQVLLGWLPWDLECVRRANVYKARRRLGMNENDLVNEGEIDRLSEAEVNELVENRAYEAWQRRWHGSVNGRVTYEFVKDVRFACKLYEFEPSLRVCYILTGHGTLNDWLYERNLAESPVCLCGSPRENWVHVLCECDMYACFRNLDEMGVIVRGDGSMDVSQVLRMKGTYMKMCSFIERAYRMRESVIARNRMNEGE